MPLADDIVAVKKKQAPESSCYHCGASCVTDKIAIDNKLFCCEGCKLVYEILSQNGLCNYYSLEQHPGLSQIKAVSNDRYRYLDDDAIASSLYLFTDGSHTVIS